MDRFSLILARRNRATHLNLHTADWILALRHNLSPVYNRSLLTQKASYDIVYLGEQLFRFHRLGFGMSTTTLIEPEHTGVQVIGEHVDAQCVQGASDSRDLM